MTAHLSHSNLVANAVQRVDEDPGGCAGRVRQAILDDKALPERQQDEYAYQRDAQQVRNDSPQLWSIHLLQAWHQL